MLHTSFRTADAIIELRHAISSTLQPRYVTTKFTSYWSIDACRSRTEFRNDGAVISEVIMEAATGPEELLALNRGSYFYAA
jgi:hypothetical protein